ncbi:hypothetical protein [Leucobacter ruminantium]|uniref:Uncharacterized protein n=1 Tax=Leucobacter ruminantium TaxID=1289170 RepID=A0A939M0G3_9MICO|nr:hypothetical protein [Leucobacter ruminantium]MBO1805772.1 hypothetical protein [Leucobacter ruminantium]
MPEEPLDEAQREEEDATRVVPSRRPASEEDEATRVVPRRSGAEEDEATRVVARRVEEEDEDDATRVSPRRPRDDGDATRVVPRRPAVDEDATRIAPRRPRSGAAPDADETRVAPRRRVEERGEAESARPLAQPSGGVSEPVGREGAGGAPAVTGRGIPRGSETPAPPVPPPPAPPVPPPPVPSQPPAPPLPQVDGQTGDLQAALRNAGTIPRVYGARATTTDGGPAAPDAVLQRIGPAPEGEAPPAIVRPDMPSLERRFARTRLVTLACYAAAIAVSACGLWLMARLAFA